MRTSTPPRLSAAAAERLLDGGDGPADLRRLLTAAAGPGTASELAGERAAVAAFSAPLPGTSPERPSMLSTILSRTMAAKAVALFVLTAGATGGVALAASSAYAPTEAPGSSNSQAADAAARPAAADDDDDLDGSGDRPAADTGGPGSGDGSTDRADATGATGSSGPPDQALPGLCRAWLAGPGDNPGRAADNPVFTLLVDTAGGPGEVTAYCDDLVAGSAEHPTGPPTGDPAADHPNGPPEDHRGTGRADDAPAPPEHAGR